jgi:hypothetical protein
MRRAIAAAVTGGLVLGGAVAMPAYAAVRGAAKAPDKVRQAAPVKPRAGKSTTTTNTNTTKTVVFDGYEFKVPASWSVHRLDEYPRTCVRYDVHAVYLGTPGSDMRCPAELVGRTQTVSFIPGQPPGTRSGTRRPDQPGENGGTDVQRLPAVHSVITQNAVQHEMSVALGTSTLGATVLGTYGTDPAVVKQVLSTLHLAPPGTAPTTQPVPAPVRPRGKGPRSIRRAQLPSTSTSWPGVPAHWPIEVVQPPPPPPPPFHPVGGFDTCTAPSLPTMRAWRSDYADIGVYIGGVNSGCAYGNLSASWMRTVASETWGVLPTYVGPQAPCWSGTGVLIDPGSAAAEGTAAAANAISEARAFDLGTGSPIYYDMEAYNGGTGCTEAVLQFLSAWDQRVAAAGYVTGVYSSQDSGIADMQLAASTKEFDFTPPNAVWFALWDENPTLSDGDLWWPLSERTKQYAGNVIETLGGFTLYIDKDIVGGPVAHLLS